MKRRLYGCVCGELRSFLIGCLTYLEIELGDWSWWDVKIPKSFVLVEIQEYGRGGVAE